MERGIPGEPVWSGVRSSCGWGRGWGESAGRRWGGLVQPRPSSSRSFATLWRSPPSRSRSRTCSRLMGGLRSARTWSRSASTAAPGAKSIWSTTKSSGWRASMPKESSTVEGKSLKLKVTMVWAPAQTAAARTCRSSGSGSVNPPIRLACPETMQSGIASVISRLVRASASALSSGRYRPIARKHSSRISSDHFACTSPVRASRIKKSRSGAGYSTQAS